MTDHDALTVSTARCHRMNCTFEAVECHGLSSLRDLERLVYSLPQTSQMAMRDSLFRRQRYARRPVPGPSFLRKAPAGYAAAGALHQGRYRWVYGER
jgi:hypothetical protein